MANPRGGSGTGLQHAMRGIAHRSPLKMAWLTRLLCFLAFPAVSANPSCTVQEDYCYQGDILNVDFSAYEPVASTFTGCLPVDPPVHVSCCSLCAQHWPACKSWIYVKARNTGDVGGNYDDKQGYCCLLGSYRNDDQPSTDCTCCDSGYIAPECTLTEGCNVEVYGTAALSDANQLLIKPDASTLCGDSSSENWSGITNPTTASSTQDWFTNNNMGVTYDKQTYNYGSAGKGRVGFQALLQHRPWSEQ